MRVGRTIKSLSLFTGGFGTAILLWTAFHHLKLSPVSFSRPEATTSAILPNGTEITLRGAMIRKTEPFTLRLFSPHALITVKNFKSNFQIRLQNIFPQSEIKYPNEQKIIVATGSQANLTIEAGGTYRIISPPKESFKFVALGDVECKTEEEIAQMKTVLLSLVGRTESNFVVLLGDIVRNNEKMLEKVADSLAELPFPVYTLVGNHDYNSFAPDAFCRHLAPMNYHFAFSDALFIFFNNADEFLPSFLPSLEMEKTVSLLENCSAKAILFFCHKPLDDPRPNSDHAMNRPSAAAYLKRKILDANVDVVLSGHIRVWSVKKEKNTLFITTGKGLKDDAQIALVEVKSDGNVTVEPVFVWEMK
ncbi:MAG: metallophosphoesterase [Planctomycetota bacterium]|nr:metallophosphoesterase [Planctomycetota bacterium]